MFIKVHSKESGKEAYFNFDYVLGICQEEDRTILTFAKQKNVKQIYEVMESAEYLVAKLNGGDMQ